MTATTLAVRPPRSPVPGGARHITAIPPTVTTHALASGAVVIAVATGIRRWLVANRHPVLLPLTITGLDRVFDIRPALARALPCLGDGLDG